MSTSKTTARPAVILATLAAIAIALAVCATAATVIVASDVTREREKLAERSGAVTGQPFDEARSSLEGLASLREAVDSIIAPLSPFPTADSVTTVLMARLWTGQRAEHPAWQHVPAGATPADTPSVSLSILSALRADSVLSADSIAAASADTLTPWLAIWRRHARSAQLPPMWGFRPGLPGVSSTFDLPRRNVGGVRTLVSLNELAGRLALRAGRTDEARERGLEIVAASRHYLESPVLLDFAVGKFMVMRGAGLIADAAKLSGDAGAEARARHLESLGSPGLVAFNVLSRAADRDAADPASPIAMELFDDEKLPFAVRVEVLYAVVRGACNHTREVIFGFSPQREQQLAALAERNSGDPTLSTMLRLMSESAKRVRENPESVINAGRFPTSGALDFLLPQSMAARAVACQDQF